MKQILAKKHIFHPIIFAICPVLSVYFINRSIVPITDLLNVLGIVVLISVFIWGTFHSCIRDFHKSSVLSSVFILFLYLFQTLLYGSNSLIVLLGLTEQLLGWLTSDSYLIFWFLFELLVFVLISIQVLRNKWNSKKLSDALEKIAILLFVVSILSWVPTEIFRIARQKSLIDPFDSEWNSWVQNEPCLVKKPSGHTPDIYIIVLDGYLRDDVLEKVYGLDNSSFIDNLEQRGFFVARNSRSNHRHTATTLSSMLNYEFLENLAQITGLNTFAENNIGPVIHSNRVTHQLKCLGYKTTSISTGFYYSEFPDSDLIIRTGSYPSSFLFQMASTTPFSLLSLKADYDVQRHKMVATLEALKHISQENSPQFVFSHVMIGHPPFLFDSDGNPVNPSREMRFDTKHYFQSLITKDQFLTGYRDQIDYLTPMVLETVDGILKNSDEPPIIILMGDHGPGFFYASTWERMSILNAYFFPDGHTDKLYQGITPVNSFRVIFNTYFGTQIPLANDISNYAPPDNYSIQDVTHEIPENYRIR